MGELLSYKATRPQFENKPNHLSPASGHGVTVFMAPLQRKGRSGEKDVALESNRTHARVSVNQGIHLSA